MNKSRVPVNEQDPLTRKENFSEVCYGYSLEQAFEEACRCLNCKNPLCVSKCPVGIDIPGFISHLKNRDLAGAYEVISRYTSLPAVCGRVCPQEEQCESGCVLGKKSEPVAIGKLERYVGDWALEHDVKSMQTKEKNGHKVAVVGSGPAGLTCARELAAMGYDVTIFEALHEPGGVLAYGIPEFRLPKDKVVRKEIKRIQEMGVRIETDVIIGRTLTIDELLTHEKFEAVFIGSGAGLPRFMNIKGENSKGVFSANEILTRINLMKAYNKEYDTPVHLGKKVVVVGGGNVAMDAARASLRMGCEVTVVYRRSEEELPARLEEVHHAKEEGIVFRLLTNPVEIINDEDGWVAAVRCIRMELGAPDSSGRRRPVEVKGSEFEIPTDTVIMAIGTSPNPLITSVTPDIKVNSERCIVTDGECRTSKTAVYAGGDAASGAATVILAMQAGKKAAASIDLMIKNRYK